MTKSQLSGERQIIFLIGAVQFINILDFMMVMPLGPDFARALNVPMSHLGFVGGSYTLAAAVAGVVGSYFLDLFDRRQALGVCMLGLGVGTIFGGLATGLNTLLLARVVAGIFGGPATSVSLSIIADIVPAERRGKALGAVMGAFAVAAVFGVPLGLEIAQRASWRAPFFSVGFAGLFVTLVTFLVLPAMRGHLGAARVHTKLNLSYFLTQRRSVLALVVAASVMVSSFLLIPNISAYLQFNLGYPRGSIGTLYLIGGLITFACMRISGALVDRFGATVVGAGGTVLYLIDVYCGFVDYRPIYPVLALFVGFMLHAAFRNVPLQTVLSKIPEPHERAQFMSMQSAVQHLACAAGSFIAAQMLIPTSSGRLEGMPRVAGLSMGFAVLLPILLWQLEPQQKKGQAQTVNETGS